MDMNVFESDEVTHVVLDGRFDIAGAQEVDGRFHDLSETTTALVVDLAKVSFLASLGMRTLMLSAKTLIRRGGEMAVCAANENVEKALRSTGFDEIVDFYPDFSTAAAAVKAKLAPFKSKKA